MEHYKQYRSLIPAADKCDIAWAIHCATHKETANATISFVLFYVLPLCVMTFCYISIIHRLWIRKPIGDILANPTNHYKRKAQKMHNTITMILLVVVFG